MATALPNSPARHFPLASIPLRPSRSIRSGFCFGWVSIQMLAMFLFPQAIFAQSWQEKLMKEDIKELASESLAKGDVRKGAEIFVNPRMTCVQCHNRPGHQLAPRLSQVGKKFPTKNDHAQFIITSILNPSKDISDGFQTGVFLKEDGETLTGLVKSEPKETSDGNFDFQLLLAGNKPELKKYQGISLEDWKYSKVSSMPTGLISNLKDRKQFLDLVKYLHYIQSKGPQAELRTFPISTFFPKETRKAYEADINHKRLITGWNRKVFQQGKRIFARHCSSCHGEVGKEGLMPTSLRFDSGKFKNGSDPYSIYQTLTDGYGLMIAQHQLVPKEKYAVIHYIRQHYLKDHNPPTFTTINDDYLNSLPKGSSIGPKGRSGRRWLEMDYGNHLLNTLEVGTDGTNIAQKGIAIRLNEGPGGVAKGDWWALFEHDTLRLAAVWKHDPKGKHRFIDWNGIHFNDRHAVHPRIAGRLLLENKTAPGWSNPKTGSFSDSRLKGRDGNRYGPLERNWGRFKGIAYQSGRPVIEYRVGETDVAESYALTNVGGRGWVTRSLKLSERSGPLAVQLANWDDSHLRIAEAKQALVFRIRNQKEKKQLIFVVRSLNQNSKILKQKSVVQQEDDFRLTIPSGDPNQLEISFLKTGINEDARTLADQLLAHKNKSAGKLAKSNSLSKPIESVVMKTSEGNGLEVETFRLPEDNPWKDRLRLTGLDFLPNPDQMVVCCWDGTVWRVDGLLKKKSTNSKHSFQKVRWTRIAEGLFQPLGIKVRDGKVYVACRDQIVLLEDDNKDGVTDRYVAFNSDHQVTEHFHEFAMGLQTDKDGNFYYAKSARHARKALVPHHGTLLKVSKDGSETEILAKGFRAANGVCINPDGSFLVTDQEGHWNPKNRINWVQKGGFYGNMWGYHDVTDTSDSAMDQPLCWITNKFDRSPGELLWCDDTRWGPLGNHHFNLSYGEGRIYLVLPQKIGSTIQGGMVPLPIPDFPTGVMRGRIHPVTGELYCCGMYAWAGNRQKPGGLYRVKKTGKTGIPIEMQVFDGQIRLKFSEKLDRGSAVDVRNYCLKSWSLRRSANYGSPHLNQKDLSVQSIKISDDDSTVVLSVKDLKPTMGMEIRYRIRSEDGSELLNLIHNTIHKIPPRKEAP